MGEACVARLGVSRAKRAAFPPAPRRLRGCAGPLNERTGCSGVRLVEGGGRCRSGDGVAVATRPVSGCVVYVSWQRIGASRLQLLKLAPVENSGAAGRARWLRSSSTSAGVPYFPRLASLGRRAGSSCRREISPSWAGEPTLNLSPASSWISASSPAILLGKRVRHAREVSRSTLMPARSIPEHRHERAFEGFVDCSSPRLTCN